METLISLNAYEVFRLPANSQWECVGGAGWLSQQGEDIIVQCGSRITVDKHQDAVIEALGGQQIRLQLLVEPAKNPLAQLFARWPHRIA